MDNPMILAMLQMDMSWPRHDEVPWCSAFANFVCRAAGLPRSRDLRARSWLFVGTPISLFEAVPGFDVVIFNRGGVAKPILDGPGHVFFYSGHTATTVEGVGGNQGNGVSLASRKRSDVLGVRRLSSAF